jgi:hypothetical protein
LLPNIERRLPAGGISISTSRPGLLMGNNERTRI